jgi:peptidoglycan/xylan/chitin deacetylase (PgdA/CDA1 family)
LRSFSIGNARGLVPMRRSAYTFAAMRVVHCLPESGVHYNLSKTARPKVRRKRNRWLTAALAAFAVFAGADTAAAADSASIVTYHRFGDSRYPATNIRLDQFEEHIAELTSGKYAVLPLPEIVSALLQGRALPDRTVAITIDDAFLSVYTEAWPRLRKARLPFTLFVATEPVTQGLPDFMSWDHIREMRDGGVTIAAHTHSHLHMVEASHATNRTEIETSNRLFEKELGAVPKLFAYPFGEASLAIMDLVRKAGYTVAFGQHSGAMNASRPHFYLPRFPLNEAHGSQSRLRLALNALPLPVTGVTPADPLVPPDANPPAYGFTLDKSVGKADRLACYHSREGKARIERIGERRIEVRVANPLAKGRSRINCTLPGPSGRWYWLGDQFYVKKR